MSPEEFDKIVPKSVAKLPLAIPVWLLVLYVAVLVLLGNTLGGLLGILGVLLTGFVSFQFWMYVIHRSIRKNYTMLTEKLSTDK